jgi:penicillin-binding protein 2
MLDRAIASFHPPGSTFKILLATAGLETGVVRPADTVVCNGFAMHYNRRRLCWKRGGHGVVNLHKALAQSCNVYFYQLGRDLGIDRINEYGLRFGLGAPTGIDVPGEVPGVLPSRDWKQQVFREIWYPGDTISVAIGQGLLSTTPLQMASTVSVVATGGWIPTPHIYESNARESRKTDLSPASLRIVRAALADAVKQGTGRQAQVEGVAVAGKTGTAQIHSSSAGVDSDDLPRNERDHGWFVGYAPADQPQIAFAVIVEHGGHGGSSAAPIVREVLEVFFSEQPIDEDLRAGVAQEGEADVGTTTAR